MLVMNRLPRTLLPALTLAAVAAAASVVILGAQAPATPAPAAPSAPRPPASTLTRPTAVAKPVDADGFIQRWLLLEPIRVNGQLTDSAVQAAVTKEYFPEQLSRIAGDGDKVTVDGTDLVWRAVDTKNYNVNLYHFAYALNKPTSNVLFWTVTTVNAPAEMPNVRLAIGSNAASVWWVNGEEVIGLYNDRQAVIDDGVSRRITLKKGPNVVRAAIINAGGATDFCARFLDKDDKPVRNLTVSLTRDMGYR